MPRPFFIALGAGLVAVWLLRRAKTRAGAVAAAQPAQPTPNQGGYSYPKTAARVAPSVKPATTIDPYPTAQEGQELAGIANADGTFASMVDDPMYRQWDERYEGNFGGDW